MPSSIPGAVANLQSLLNAAFASQPGTQVWFGKTLSQYVAPLTVQWLGWNGDQQPASLGPSYRREETYAIQMEICATGGDMDFMSRQATVMAAFATISVLVANNWTLPSTAGGNDGAVRFAEVGTFNFSPESDVHGFALGILTFDIHCSQRITSLT